MIAGLETEYFVLIAGLVAIVAVAALLLWENESRQRTIMRVATQRKSESTNGSPGREPVRLTANPGFLQRLGATTAQAAMIGRKEVDETAHALTEAGLRGRTILHQIMGARVIIAVIGLVGPLLWSSLAHPIPGIFLLISCLTGALLGWRGPMLVIKRMGMRRRMLLDQELPNVIDLLVVCGEAGLSIEAGVERVVREMGRSCPEIAQEFAIVSAELRLLPERSMAFNNLYDRIRTEGARALATTLAQASRYGTPLGVALRVLSGEMRGVYQLRMEERAARLPVLLTLPMILFILPCVFIVVCGPAAMQVLAAIKGV